MTRSLPLALALFASLGAFSASAQPARPAPEASVTPSPETSVPCEGGSDDETATDAPRRDARPDGAATSPAGMSASTPEPEHADDQAQITSSKHARSAKRRAEDRPSNTTH